jgi:uncharacterized metal-binding protein
MAASCCYGGTPAALAFACSGCSNVGQLSNDVAVKLTREGYGKMSCLAGVGAHIRGFVVSAKDAQRLVAIDGCDLHGTLKVLQHAEASPYLRLTLTDRGFVNKHCASVTEDELERAFAIAVKRIKELPCSTDS